MLFYSLNGLYLLQIQNWFKMAKIKYSALVSDMRNKLNGSVLSKNRFGSYIRNKVTPVNPQSIAQTLVRARFAQFSQQWRTLTEVQRDAWNSAVDQWQTTDIFGDLKSPTGLQLFVRINANIANAGGAVVLLPPAPAEMEAVALAEVTAEVAGSEVIVNFAPTPVPAGFALVVEATEQVSPGINFVKNKYRQIDVLAAATASGANLFAEYTAKFGGLVAGQKLFIRLKLINLTTGQVSIPVQASTIVA